jgi:hypothetical protein
MNDEQFFLANAYVDGELTAEERRIAETDPDVMSEVEWIRALQAEVRAVEPPSPTARESAIAAAMVEFVAHSPAESTTWAPIPFRARPAYAKYLGVAAAVVALVGVGVVVSQAGLGGGDDDAATSMSEFPAAEMTAEAADSGTALIDSAERAGSAEEPTVAGDEVMDGGLENDQGEPSSEVAAEESEENTSDATDFGPSDRVSVPPDFDAEAPITDDLELGIYGAYLLDQRDRGELGPTPEQNCPGPYSILAESTYVVDGAPERPAYVGVEETAGLVYAIDVETCDELAVGSLTDP